MSSGGAAQALRDLGGQGGALFGGSLGGNHASLGLLPLRAGRGGGVVVGRSGSRRAERVAEPSGQQRLLSAGQEAPPPSATTHHPAADIAAAAHL